MHWSVVTTPLATGRAGDSRGNERGFDQSYSTVVGDTRGLFYTGKKGRENEKIAGCGGKQQWFYQREVPAGWGFSRDLLDQKSNVQGFFGPSMA